MYEEKSVITTNIKDGYHIYEGPMPDPGEEVYLYSPRCRPLSSKEGDVKKKYEKPKIKQELEMKFMFGAIENLPTKITCRQCSSCHSCR